MKKVDTLIHDKAWFLAKKDGNHYGREFHIECDGSLGTNCSFATVPREDVPRFISWLEEWYINEG